MMSAINAPSPRDYVAAIESAAWYQIQDPGYLRISGETRREYIQRQTTNDIDLLAPDRALPTLLTQPTGRILEYYTLLDFGESIAMLTQPGHGPGNAAYFQKRIFFNDKVFIQDQSGDWAQIELLGPKASGLFGQFDFTRVPEINEVLESNWRGAKVIVFGQMGFGVSSRFRILFPSKLIDELLTHLEKTPKLSFASREMLRIESSHAGDPEFAAETTPFELGLDRLVSTTKGCYTGQEVLARQFTYDKVVRHLVRLQANHPMVAGAHLTVDGKSVGQISSVAISPRLGPIALGVVRKPYDELGTNLSVQGENISIMATVS